MPKETAWIQTYSGLQFWPFSPVAADHPINLTDIAHALSLKCRFGGHCRKFYSAAQHSVEVAAHVSRKVRQDKRYSSMDSMDVIRRALLHDAPEAYLIDIPSPLKSAFMVMMPSKSIPPGPDSPVSFKLVEKGIWELIAKHFNLLEGPIGPVVREADLRMLATEQRDVMNPMPDPQAWDDQLKGVKPYSEMVDPLSPDGAEMQFLWWAEKLELGV